MRLSPLLALLLLALVLAPAAGSATATSAAQHAGTIVGTVTDMRGHAVAGAPVLLHGQTAGGHPYHARTVSGRDGSFGFHEVPAGHYVVASRVEGIGSGAERVALRPGQTVRVHLVLH